MGTHGQQFEGNLFDVPHVAAVYQKLNGVELDVGKVVMPVAGAPAAPATAKAGSTVRQPQTAVSLGQRRNLKELIKLF